MDNRENALRTIRFDSPERMAPIPVTTISYQGCHHEGYTGGGHDRPVGETWTDIWGTVWHKEQEGVMGFPRDNPLADLPHAIGSYQWPDPDDERICRKLHTMAADADRTDRFLAGFNRDTLWEKSYMLVGMDRLMCYFYTDPEAVRELFHSVIDFQLGIARHHVALGVELVYCSDDMGTQNALLLPPDIIQEFLVPEYRRLFSFYKQHDVIINFHSCGHIMPLIDTFIDLGVDILNPIQASANDLLELRRRTLGRLTLQGGIPSPLVYSGPAEAIEEEVKRCIWNLGRDGGYFCEPDQGLPWPEDHIAALRRAVSEYGRYPLTPPAAPAPAAETALAGT